MVWVPRSGTHRAGGAGVCTEREFYMSLPVGSTVYDALAGVFGEETVTLTHRGTATSLSARIVGESDEWVQEEGVAIVRRVLTVAIKVQTGFTAATAEAESVEPGDLVTRQSRIHVVQSPIGKSTDGQVYQLRCVQQKHSAHGVK
jgi:hypothetical protein